MNLHTVGNSFGRSRSRDLAAGQQPQGRLVDDGLGRGREAPALGQEPRLEGLRVGNGQPVEQVIADSERDRWFGAEEAKAYGMIDHVIVKRGTLL